MKRIKQFKDFKGVNEGQHGSITIYGKNDGEPRQKVGYASSVDAAKDIEDDFRDNFDEIWYEDDDVLLKNF